LSDKKKRAMSAGYKLKPHPSNAAASLVQKEKKEKKRKKGKKWHSGHCFETREARPDKLVSIGRSPLLLCSVK